MGPPHLAGMPVRVCTAGVGMESTPRLEQGLAALCRGRQKHRGQWHLLQIREDE